MFSGYAAHVGDYGSLAAISFTGQRGTETPDISGAIFAVRVRKPTHDPERFRLVDIGGDGWAVTLGSACTFTYTPSSSDDIDIAGEWTFYVSVTVGTSVITLNPISKTIGPQGGMSPGSVATINPVSAQIAAALAYWGSVSTDDTPAVIRFPPGTYTLSSGITVTALSNLVLEFEPGARIVGTFTGTADSATNALIQFVPTDSAVATTVTTDAAAGDLSLVVASTTGFAANDWIRVHSPTAEGSSPLNDGGIFESAYAVYQVESVTDATHLSLKTPVHSWHSSVDTVSYDPSIVTKITPCRNITIRGGFWDGTGGAAIAVGVLFRSCVGVTVEGVKCEGFSRAALDFDQGSKYWRVDGYYREGGSNCEILSESCFAWTITRTRFNPDGARTHASGVPRGFLVSRTRNVAGSIVDCDLGRHVIGISWWGGWHMLADDIHCRDLDCTERLSRGTPDGVNGKCGIAFDGGSTSVTQYTEYGSYWQLSNFFAEECTGAIGASGPATIYLHDCHGAQASNVQIINRGRSGTASGARTMPGMKISDIQATCDLSNIAIRGVNGDALVIENSGAQKLMMRNVSVTKGAGTLPHPTTEYAVYFALASGAFVDMTLDGFRSDYDNVFKFVASQPNYQLAGRDIHVAGDSLPTSHVVVALNNSGGTLAHGDIVDLDASSAADTRRIVTPGAGGSLRSAVVVCGLTGSVASGAFCFVAIPGLGSVTNPRIGGAANCGDLIRHNLTRVGIADNAAAAGHVLGRILYTKGAPTAVYSVG